MLASAVGELTRSFMLFAVASVLNCHLKRGVEYLYQCSECYSSAPKGTGTRRALGDQRSSPPPLLCIILAGVTISRPAPPGTGVGPFCLCTMYHAPSLPVMHYMHVHFRCVKVKTTIIWTFVIKAFTSSSLCPYSVGA